MSHKTLNHLPAETIKLISSTQIITSVSTAIKELVENSLDAEARSIHVRLENYGFDLLEVKDDGHGISYINVQRMFLSGCTSKISCFNDLAKLETYGFRGEALSALAKLSNVTVTTKTASDSLAMTFAINNDGIPESSKPSHLQRGTIITATNIFKNLPVRKQYLSNKRRAAEELKKIEYVVQLLSAIHPELRICLIHNKSQIWQKNSVKGLKQSFMQVVGLKVVSKLEHLNELSNNILVDLMIPKKNLDNMDNLFSNSSQSIFLYVNRRGVILNKVSKVVMEHILLQYNHLNPPSKYSVCLISIEVPPQELDVNLEPNKTRILLKNEAEVISLIDKMLGSYYGQTISRPEPEPEIESTNLEQLNDEEEEEEGENSGRKRLCLDTETLVANVRDKEFTEKNSGWKLQVLSADDTDAVKNSALSLCSQINRENCTLTTHEEIRELNMLVNKNSQKLVTSFDARPVERNENQVYDKMNTIRNMIVKENSVESAEKPVLPSWPVRESSQKILQNDKEESIDVPNVQSEKSKDNLIDKDILDKVNLIDWSMGRAGNEVLPESVLGSEKVLPSGVALLTTGCSDVLEDDVKLFDLSMRSVSSQMGKKELSAFTKFARVMRPKILQEFPGLLFTKVATLLVERWKALSQDEKLYYEKLSKVVDQKREIHQEFKTVDEVKSSRPLPMKKKAKFSDKKPVRSELQIVSSFDGIIRKRSILWKDESEIRPIGQLQPSGNWLYKKGSEIGHVRHRGLQELILSQRMLSNHNVPRHPIPKPIFINEDILGSDLWKTLSSMDFDYDPITSKYTVTSSVVSKNGFKVDLEKNGETFVSGYITEVASMIPFYGIAELKDTLRLYHSKGDFADLASVRTTAVTNYITNEAIRIVQQNPRPPDLKDIKEWIDTWNMCLKHLPPKCLHSNDIFVPIHYLKEDFIEIS